MTVKAIELTGTFEDSWKDAAQQALTDADEIAS